MIMYLLDAGGHLGSPLRGHCCLNGDCLESEGLGDEFSPDTLLSASSPDLQTTTHVHYIAY